MMATQINRSDPEQVTQVQTVRPGWKWPLVGLATLIALVIGFLWVGQPIPENQSQRQHVRETDAARYSGLAGYYLAKDEVNQQRAIGAEAARYNGLAAYYLAKDEANRQRAIEAEAARYNGLARFFTAGK